MPNYKTWMRGFMDSWKKLDGEEAMSFIAPDCKYYEAPDGAPCENWEKIRELWLVVSNNQKDISYSFEVICSDEKVGIINWKMERTLLAQGKEVRQRIDGIFQVSLDENNLCTYFKQWRHTVII